MFLFNICSLLNTFSNRCLVCYILALFHKLDTDPQYMALQASGVQLGNIGHLPGSPRVNSYSPRDDNSRTGDSIFSNSLDQSAHSFGNLRFPLHRSLFGQDMPHSDNDDNETELPYYSIEVSLLELLLPH